MNPAGNVLGQLRVRSAPVVPHRAVSPKFARGHRLLTVPMEQRRVEPAVRSRPGSADSRRAARRTPERSPRDRAEPDATRTRAARSAGLRADPSSGPATGDAVPSDAVPSRTSRSTKPANACGQLGENQGPVRRTSWSRPSTNGEFAETARTTGRLTAAPPSSRSPGPRLDADVAAPGRPSTPCLGRDVAEPPSSRDSAPPPGRRGAGERLATRAGRGDRSRGRSRAIRSAASSERRLPSTSAVRRELPQRRTRAAPSSAFPQVEVLMPPRTST